MKKRYAMPVDRVIENCRGAGCPPDCEMCLFLECPECGREMHLRHFWDAGDHIRCPHCCGWFELDDTLNLSEIDSGMSSLGAGIFLALLSGQKLLALTELNGG